MKELENKIYCYFCQTEKDVKDFGARKESKNLVYENRLVLELSIKPINGAVCSDCLKVCLRAIADSKILWKENLFDLKGLQNG